MMLVQQMKEPIAKGSINFICKNLYQNSTFQSAENFNFENFSPSLTMVGPLLDSVYEQMSSTFSANSAYKISKMALL